MDSQRDVLERIHRLLTTRLLFVAGFSAVLISVMPYYVLGQDATIGIHDTFDSYFVWYNILADSNMLFAGQLETVPVIMDGLPRIVYGSELNVLVWLFVFFEPYSVYVMNLTAMRTVAFLGMFLLLRTHFLRDEQHNIIVVGVALCFSLLPFYPPGGLSISSLPLALYAFMRIRSKRSTKLDWLILLLIPFYASIIFSYLFFLMMIGFLWLWDLLRNRDLGLKILGAIALMTAEFVLIEYRLILGVFFSNDFVSHRTEFEIGGLSIPEALSAGLKNFIQGSIHAPSLHGVVILFAVFFGLVLVFLSRFDSARAPLLMFGLTGIGAISGMVILFGYERTVGLMNAVLTYALFGSLYPFLIILGVLLLACFTAIIFFFSARHNTLRMAIRENSDTLKVTVILLGVCALFSLWYGLWYSILLVPWREEYFILRTVYLSRVHWLHPLLWYILFAASLSLIQRRLSFRSIDFGKILAIALIILQMVLILPNTWETVAIQGTDTRAVTYREFVAAEMFQEIEDDIGIPQESYRVINIGLHPSVSQFNGFYTLDGYFNNYPLSYKHRFRNIIAYELAKNSLIRDYFDDWGSRCYVLTDELGFDFYVTKDKGIVLDNLELNVTAMYEMNVSYVFSAVNITNHAANSLQFRGVYQHAESAIDIYLYELI